jgi:acetoacetate decarboxylase
MTPTVDMRGKLCRHFEADWMACGGGSGTIDCNYAITTATGDPKFLRPLVPAPLEATNEVLAYYGSFKKTVIDGKVVWAWPFEEWGIGIRVKLSQPPYHEGLYLVSMYVNDDLVLTHGREIWGWPKKMADFKCSPDTAGESDRYDYTVTRRGSRLVTGSLRNLKPIKPEDFPLQTGYVINFKQVPSATSWMIKSQELVFNHVVFPQGEAWAGDASIEIKDGIADQLPFGPLKNLKGYFGRRTFVADVMSPLVVDALELARPLESLTQVARQAAE